MSLPPVLRALGRKEAGRVIELGLLFGLVLWLFRDVLLFGGVYYKRDVHLVWHPQVEGFVRAVLSGAWPVWNESLAFGQPLLADPSAQVLYPPTSLNLLMRPWVYYTLFAVAHFVLAVLGMRALGRRVGLSPKASLLAALGFGLSGPYISMVDLWHHYAGASLMPWVVLAAVRALGGGLKETVQFGLVLALQILAGSADLVAITLLLAAAVAGRPYLKPAWPPPSETRVAAGRFAGAVALALGSSAPLWMPALEIVSRAARADLPAGVRAYWSLHPLAALETALPGLFSALPLHPELRKAFFESREPFLTSLYLGASILALAGAAATASRHPLRWVLVAALLSSLLFAMGPHTPLYGLAATVLPPLRILRYPVKAMVAAAFAGSLLAGLGADAWRDPASRRRLVWGTAGPASLVLLLGLGAALALRARPEAVAARLIDPAAKIGPEVVFPPAVRRLLVPAGLAGAVLGLIFAYSRDRLSGAAAAAALSLISAGDLAVYHRTPNPAAPVALYTHRPEIVAALGDPRTTRVYVYDYSSHGKADPAPAGRAPNALARMPAGWTLDAASALGMQTYLAPETGGRFGFSQAFNIDYRGLYSSPLHRLTRLLREVEGSPLHLRLLRAAGVDRAVSLHPLADLELERTIEGLFEKPILVQRVPDPLPRVYVVGASRQGDDKEAVARLLDDGFDPRREVVLAEGPTTSEPPGFRGRARLVETRSDRVVLHAEANAPGFVVLLEGYDPGWRARLDGRAVPLLRANLAFRAVAVPQGEHRIELLYRPRGLLVGLALSGLSLALAAAALGTRRRSW
jgi:hypothetical protein